MDDMNLKFNHNILWYSYDNDKSGDKNHLYIFLDNCMIVTVCHSNCCPTNTNNEKHFHCNAFLWTPAT